MELTKKELQQIIVDAIHEDRDERDKKLAKTVIDVNDIESPSYNTNRLFTDQRKQLLERINGVQQGFGMGYEGKYRYEFPLDARWLPDKIKAVVYEAFNAKNSRYILPGYRQQAKDLYQAIADSWMDVFTVWCSSQTPKD